MMKKVYLAGPITGCTWGESEDWRDEIVRLAFHSGRFTNVEFFSPLRGKEYLKDEAEIKDSYSQHQMSTAKSIMLRDHHDVKTSDAVIVNLMGAKRVSIGTVMEVAWAYERRTPVIAIMEPPVSQETGFEASQGNIHEHSMLNEAIWWRVQNLQDALKCLRLLFNP
jgi:nucleoside 2-deoxyribosyltransferase